MIKRPILPPSLADNNNNNNNDDNKIKQKVFIHLFFICFLNTTPFESKQNYTIYIQINTVQTVILCVTRLNDGRALCITVEPDNY